MPRPSPLYPTPASVLAQISSSRLVPRANAFSKAVGYHLETVYLFTKSDIKTTLIPITIFAIGTAPPSSSGRVQNTLKAIFWLWSVLLQFNLINQTVVPEEDADNKPWRPIPSGRISLRHAIIARWISIQACALISSYFGPSVLVSCILFTFFASLYNFGDGDKNGFVKNLINGFGSCSLALGTTLVASCDNSLSTITDAFNWRNFPELTLFFFVIITTIHAQDFQDVEGDRGVGRNTIPMILPEISRMSMPIILPMWSVGVALLVNSPLWLAAAYVALSMLIGFRFVFMRQVKDDKLSYVLYNVWLSMTIIHMGLYKRHVPQTIITSTSLASTPFINNLTRQFGVY